MEKYMRSCHYEERLASLNGDRIILFIESCDFILVVQVFGQENRCQVQQNCIEEALYEQDQ